MEFLAHYTSFIENELQQLDLPDTPRSLYEPQRYILSNGGKRIRPIFTLIGCGMCGGEYKEALPAALAVELVHNFTLLHDDIMDQAESRRGKPSVHKKWNEATAILAGDAMFIQSLFQLQKLPDSADHKKITRLFLEGVNTVCEGQALDMEFEQRFDVKTEEYLDMIAGKTGALISTSLQMGGLVAGATSAQLRLLDVIGRSAGLAFQVQDDWLDVVADPEKFGKEPAGDVREGKKTFLMLKTLERCNEVEKDWLIHCLKDKPLNEENVAKVVELIKNYGVTNEARSLVGSYYKKARKALQKFDDSNYKRDLQQLLIYLENREY